MKNLKKMATMLVLVTVMGVSSTFGGVYLTDRNVNAEVKVADVTVTNGCTNGGGSINTGVMLGGVMLGGVMLGGVMLGGVMLGGAGSIGDEPCVLGTTD